jgi:hypothetical protein
MTDPDRVGPVGKVESGAVSDLLRNTQTPLDPLILAVASVLGRLAARRDFEAGKLEMGTSGVEAG